MDKPEVVELAIVIKQKTSEDREYFRVIVGEKQLESSRSDTDYCGEFLRLIKAKACHQLLLNASECDIGIASPPIDADYWNDPFSMVGERFRLH